MIVIGASVWVSATYTADQFHAVSRRWLNAVIGRQTQIVAPTLIAPEVAGAITRRTGDPTVARDIVLDLRNEPLLELMPTDSLLDEMIQAAIDYRLRGAEATYVALARHLGVPLVTWDREMLARAATVVKVREPTLGSV